MVTFPAGMTNASFDIRIIDNDELENNETFYLIIELSSPLPINSITNLSRTIVTILDDDCK